jgi:hypothetical protein
MSDSMYPTDHGELELARRLEAFADLRLSLSASSATRMRAAVLNAAHRRAALIEAGVTSGAAGSTRSGRSRLGSRFDWPSWRRPLAAVLAGSMTLALLAGTAVGARPGGPLYGVRLWTETANLPTDLGDRAKAESTRLQERIDEAETASSAGDTLATEAALVAYSSIIAEAAQTSGADVRAAAELKATVKRQVVVLTRLVQVVPPSARPAAERALSSSTKALDDLEHRDRSRGSGGHDAPGGDGRGTRGGTGADAPSETQRPRETERPRETPKPGETPRPRETTRPDETPKPDETPDGHETPKPDEPGD